MDAAPISVLIPAHNEEEFLGEAIQSVHAQTLQPAEIIVIADACTDRTPEIAAELGATVLQQNRRNMSAGLNLGINASTQPWIALLDADDFWDKRKLALQWQAIQDFPKAALVTCDLSTLAGKELISMTRERQRERWRDIEPRTTKGCYHYLERVPGNLLPRLTQQATTTMLHRDVFSEVGFFDEGLEYRQTIELFARVMARYPMVFVERPLVYYRQHDHNHTHERKMSESWTTFVAIVDRMLKNPDLYPAGAGLAYRKRMKEQFLSFERQIALGKHQIDGDSESTK